MAYRTFQVQGTSSVSTYATLYNVPNVITPEATAAVISTIAICNTDASSATYRIGLDTEEGTPGASEWIVYGATVSANDTVFLTVGMTLAAGQYVRVSSSANTVVFSAFVSEIS
jgi:hypothetical protein